MLFDVFWRPLNEFQAIVRRASFCVSVLGPSNIQTIPLKSIPRALRTEGALMRTPVAPHCERDENMCVRFSQAITLIIAFASLLMSSLMWPEKLLPSSQQDSRNKSTTSASVSARPMLIQNSRPLKPQGDYGTPSAWVVPKMRVPFWYP